MMFPPPVPRRIAADQGQVFRLLREVVTCKALAADTGGAYALFEQETPPQGGMLPHRQRHEDVAYYVLAGNYALRIDNDTHELGPGAYAFVPRGVIQAYRNVAATPGRMLVVVSPGGVHERFLREVGKPLSDGSIPDLEKILAAAPKFGIEFLPHA